jgi:ectoine hydroxylase
MKAQMASEQPGARPDVVAEEQARVARGELDAPVAGGGWTGCLLAHHPKREARIARQVARRGGGAVARPIVHDDGLHRKPTRIPAQALEALEEDGPSVAAGDDHRQLGHSGMIPGSGRRPAPWGGSASLGAAVGVLDRVKVGLRGLKPFWTLYNLRHWRRLRSNAPRYRELGIRKSVVGSLSHRDIRRPAAERPWLDRPDAREALAAHPDLKTFPEAVRDQLPSWIDDGLLVLEGYFGGERIDAINADLMRLVEGGVLVPHFRDRRIMDPERASGALLAAVEDAELMRLLGFLLGREARLFRTIYFREGSEQRPHSDSFHMTTEPTGYLVAIWLALEDVDPDSGPVYYYPGSHRLPYLMSEDLGSAQSALFLDRDKDRRYEEKVAELIAEAGIEPVEFLPRKGDVLVWHANLLHGGRPIARSGATRRSVVAHYFAAGVLCYHEVTERPALVRA